MKAKSFSGMRCSMAGALEAIGDRWSLLIIRDLLLGLRRFDDLRASLDIPPATLAARLKQLGEAGLVDKTRYQERPARDEYHLSERGADLWKVTLALREWGDRWNASGFGKPMETVHRETGRPLGLSLVDIETREAVPLERATIRPGPDADDTIRELLDRQASAV